MAAAAAFVERKDLYIGGEWVPSQSRDTIEVIGASTEEPMGRVPDASQADVDRAVAAARKAFDSGPFPDWTPAERADALSRLSKALQARAPQIAETISRENGSPAQMSMGLQVFSATMVLDIYADIARNFTFMDERTGALGNRVRVRRAPVGVVAAVVPWNVPLFVSVLKLGPALAAGCSVAGSITGKGRASVGSTQRPSM